MCPGWTHSPHVFQWQAHTVSEAAGGQHNNVNNPANAEAAGCEQPKDARADFTNVESVYTEDTYNDAED